MPLEKQSLNNFLPDGFETLNQEGYKTNFSEDKIKTGYEKDIKDRVSGPNLNNLIDVVGKNTNTLNNYVEYLNGMPINNVPTVNENGQLDYTNLDDKLTKKQITNCILEIPQRIKYTLENGTLTIKAGSILIIPYGIEDKTNDLNVGDTFLHDFYKIYDTQFDDGKFFVWVELTQDITMVLAENVTGQYFLSCGEAIWSQLSKIDYYNADVTQTNIYSSETKPTIVSTRNNHYWYDLTNNVVKTSMDKGSSWVITNNTLPFLLCQAQDGQVKRVNQVFNGMGYIGSTVWVDKGVKGLIPNGRNENGTFENLEYTTSNLMTYNIIDTSEEERHIIIGNDSYLYLKNYAYDAVNNFVFNNKGGTIIKAFLLATYRNSANGIITFNVNQPLKLADYSQTCGQWVYKHQLLLETTGLKVDTHIYNFDLSDYLPKDDYPYEVLYVTDGNTGGTTASELSAYVFLGDSSEAMVVARARTRASGSVCTAGNCVITVTQKRNLKITYKVATSASGNVYARVLGYRRTAKNL